MAAITAGMVTARPDPALEVRSEEWAEDASTLAASEVVSRDFENQLIIGFSKLTDASDFVACSTEFQMKLSYIRTSRAIIQKERDIRQERIAQLSREFEQVLDQMQQAHEEAVAVNKQNERLMKLITEYISDRQLRACWDREPEENSELGSAPRKNPKKSRRVDKSSQRLSDCNAKNSDVARPKKLPGTENSTPFQISPARSDSSSDSSSSSRSASATPRFGLKSSEAIGRKSPQLVPRLDLSQTIANPGAEPETGAGIKIKKLANVSHEFQQKPAQSHIDLENPSRRTSRRTDSARLISMTDADDHLGNSADSARTLLLRIKRRAREGSCSAEVGGLVNEVGTSGTNIVKESTEVEMAEGAPVIEELLRQPPIQEMLESVIIQNGSESISAAFNCKDGARGTAVPELRRSVISPIAKIDPGPDMVIPCTNDPVSAAEVYMTKQEKVDQEKSVDLNLGERRTQLLLWSTGDKLLTLQTLNNTMFLWEDHPIECRHTSPYSQENLDLILSSLDSAKESQRRLFDYLDKMQGIPRRAICCSAVRELVRAYPPERLVPTSFINEHFVQQGVLNESYSSPRNTTLMSAQDSESAEFWQALVHHVSSVADHKMAAAEQSAKEFAEVLVHDMRCTSIVGDIHLARFELQTFLKGCFKLEPATRHLTPQGEYSCPASSHIESERTSIRFSQ
uniref:Uncharacterized protein n=1 Tax=Physcomitrium patens TaxID=3218 RepID=A0A2K1JVZ5_PHYPA|nr:hypothetical protein PHYPA_015469 [Physcomitrium patens]